MINERYVIPGSYEDVDQEQTTKQKKEALLSKRYEPEKQVRSEQEQWELDQEKKTLSGFGAQGKAKSKE